MPRTPQEARKRRSLRAALQRLREVYSDEEAGSLLDGFDAARRDSIGFRAITGALERFYPLRRFLALAAEVFDPVLGEYGLHRGCARMMEAAGVDWQHHGLGEGDEIIATAPIIFCTNHPSLLTPFLVAAAVGREDLRFLTTTYVRRLLPNLRPYSVAFEIPLTRSWTEWRRGGFRRVLVYRLLSLLHDMPPVEAAREINRRALRDGAEHLRRGGCVFIAPGGGGKRDRRWFGGIGVLARDLIERPGDYPIYVVPVREENSSNQRVYARLMQGPIARLKNVTLHRKPVRITFGLPKPLHDLVDPASTIEETVVSLRAYYREQLEGG